MAAAWIVSNWLTSTCSPTHPLLCLSYIHLSLYLAIPPFYTRFPGPSFPVSFPLSLTPISTQLAPQNQIEQSFLLNLRKFPIKA